MNWAECLEESRAIRDECKEDGDHQLGAVFLNKFRAQFSALPQQIARYVAQLERSSGNNSASSGLSKEELKSMVGDTRTALRFGLSCLSIDDNEARKSVQEKAVAHGWHDDLPKVLSCIKGDAKCRLFAARLLNNLVTSNCDCASTIVSKLPPSPSRAGIASRISSHLRIPEVESDCTDMEAEPNWTDMILCASRMDSRDTLAAVTACLHNCIVSLESIPGKSISFQEDVASNRLLVCTLLRQLIAVETAKQSLRNDDKGFDDAATEWICILLMKLCRSGMFPKVYQAAGGDTSLENVFPEQTILLHCLREEVDSTAVHHPDDFDKYTPLGGEAGLEAITATHMFLVELFSVIRTGIHSEGEDDVHTPLGKSALTTILDILGTSLGVDTNSARAMRLLLGSDTSFLADVAQDLAEIVDSLSTTTRSRKLFDLDGEQLQITSLVRVLGNMCFGCRQNQDSLRTMFIASQYDPAVQSQRSALHVLLSSTAYSHSCFALREWSVVAIRNVLDGNELNQAEVAKLQAQQPVQSSELQDMGIRVGLNPTSGNVSVVPLDKIEEEDDVDP